VCVCFMLASTYQLTNDKTSGGVGVLVCVVSTSWKKKFFCSLWIAQSGLRRVCVWSLFRFRVPVVIWSGRPTVLSRMAALSQPRRYLYPDPPLPRHVRVLEHDRPPWCTTTEERWTLEMLLFSNSGVVPEPCLRRRYRACHSRHTTRAAPPLLLWVLHHCWCL